MLAIRTMGVLITVDCTLGYPTVSFAFRGSEFRVCTDSPSLGFEIWRGAALFGDVMEVPCCDHRLPSVPKLQHTGMISGDNSAARQCSLVGDSLNDEQRCDDLPNQLSL